MITTPFHLDVHVFPNYHLLHWNQVQLDTFKQAFCLYHNFVSKIVLEKYLATNASKLHYKIKTADLII